MSNQMPRFEVFNHSVFLGYVSAVSYKKAVARAKRLWPNRRLQIEAPVNRKMRPSDILAANIEFQCKRAR